MLIAYASNLNFLEIFASASLGGIFGVVIYTYFGRQIGKVLALSLIHI